MEPYGALMEPYGALMAAWLPGLAPYGALWSLMDPYQDLLGFVEGPARSAGMQVRS